MTDHKFPYKWMLRDTNFTGDRGKVFSCFACGGGSSMGYKLAGYEVVGCNEIDPRMMGIYRANLHPKYHFCMPIQEFKNLPDLPEELYHLDVLDSSPPCSTFSMCGSRDKVWGKEKKFREGQQKQVLDTLFFDFIDLAKRLQPKVVVAENVKGLLLGKAQDYVWRIYGQLEAAGYHVQHFLLNASMMGVPQRRERVFFLGLRKDLAKPFLRREGLFEQRPYINMRFSEKEIILGEFADYKGREIAGNKMHARWDCRIRGDRNEGDVTMRILGKETNFNRYYAYPDKACPIITSKANIVHFDVPRMLSKREIVLASTFPVDYDFGKQSYGYVCGMSVPPVMMAQVATRVWEY